MKKFYILPLACAIAALTACSPAPVKQEIIIPATPQPAPQPLVLRKVEPEATAPHYRLNPRNYEQPLNPVVVQRIREALTPKIINPATGEVITRLPIRLPDDPVAQTQHVTANQATATEPAATGTSTDATALTNSAHTQQNPANSTESNNNSATPVVAVDANGLPVAEPQDTQAALLKIDPALKLDEQAVASLAASQNQPSVPNTQPATASEANPTGSTSTDSTPAVSTTASEPAIPSAIPVQTVADNTARILIPIHEQQITQPIGTPPPRDETLDVSEIDKDLTLIGGKARHYPTYFKDKFERWKSEKKIREITQRLDVLAVDPRASYELLLRAMKAHVLARNMDAGPDSAFKSAVYFQRLLKLKPADPETSFWYGFSLGEGGGFRESISHLDTAVKADYQEAYLALAHSYLQMEDKKNALTVLNNYKIKYPDESARTDQLIAEIEAGKRYSIWQ
ncbi:hypothetical protein [Alkanindiges illinoisensis]|uniref:Tetratricopeptide repeat protein n=1 Tax=Alkanindiges illinoisensis TaxID=197183 RepID=A0A4Y7X9C2_9GAMM|nr:hypothetical protein [Alkanindiges illinoisensis]TEU23058.1 hypothetical protein E2B99_14270 [Alkanindiges illinoisensis]